MKTYSVLFALLLGGCVGPLVPVSRVEDTTAVELQQTVRTYLPRETPANATVLGPLTATSCKNKLWDRDATEEDATNQLRLQARAAGAAAVGNLTCEKPEGTSLAKNCWASIVCTGTAIKMADTRPAR